MSIAEIFKQKKTNLSFEFFPPKTTQASEELFQHIEQLKALQPSFVSVTYGAGGSTRELTRELIVRLRRETSFEVVSHLTCVGHTQEEIHQILATYEAEGVSNIMALRGDPPRGEERFRPVPGGFHYASDLVAYIKKHFPRMGVGVAGFPEGHPECPNRLQEMNYLKAKVDAGADYICTQLFFDNRDFFDFCERCELAGIKVPIIAGIMPISSLKGMQRMAQLALGARFPAPLLKALARVTADHEASEVGLHWATQQVLELIHSNVRGVHFYTLNKSFATQTILKRCQVPNGLALR